MSVPRCCENGAKVGALVGSTVRFVGLEVESLVGSIVGLVGLEVGLEVGSLVGSMVPSEKRVYVCFCS